ncbi:MAG TPA: anthranilate phosphoribosyltransferase [Deltaproteobacteria bacterium]|jgi:anthranilate phosphoribosyltransferase|nr:anthranilate phosphoribosyltransferase [Deltaproteobacteria bacterium]HOI05870.1 anthranilate phosphoribosyltransferase [Deltaproteobacteria bacterium]
MRDFIEKLLTGADLTDAEMEKAFDMIMSGMASDIHISAFLVALRAKGETPSEIASAARIMREKALKVSVDFDVVDTCGTGGDSASTMNISTAVAFVLAGAGLKVAKHGNRSVSSTSGSADCLEALGVPIDLGPGEAAEALRKEGFAFMFAPKYHPSMKHAMPARKGLGMKTVFNILGPLTNPARAAYQVVGVYRQDLIDPVVECLRILGSKGAMVVHSGLDEVSVSGTTSYARLHNGTIEKGEIRPEDAGIERKPIDDLRVSTPKESADLIERVFDGSLKGACLEGILLNAGAAFMAIDGDTDIREGVQRAARAIESGEALRALQRARG